LEKQAKETKAAKRASKKAAAGGGTSSSAGGASKSRSKTKAAVDTTSPVKGGTGGNFKSKEFIEDSDSEEGKSYYNKTSLIKYLLDLE
jgi:hypothetical protein